MSRELVVIKHCDIHKTSDADETLELAFDGVKYEIDLCAPDADELRATLAPYLEAAFSKERVKGSRKATMAEREENRRIRAWARDRGHQVGETGQVPVGIREAYEEHVTGKAAKAPAAQPKSTHAPVPAKRGRGHKPGDVAKQMAVPDPKLRAAMRAFAADQGRPLGKGLIPRDIQDAYRAQLNGAAM